jgi:CRISPR-associated protein Csm3
MMDTHQEQHTLKGKLIIQAQLRLMTGLHIGASNEFAPIGAVDSPFIRDPLTKQPIIPGSSLKGKLRTLLAKSYGTGYVLNAIDDDNEIIKRVFGSASKAGAQPARLQFYDVPMTAQSVAQFESLELDTYIGEIKFENTIDRITATANPRQIERVPAGTEFSFRLTYNIENLMEIKEDIELLCNGLKLLQMDYLGGHGSRGYGRIAFHDFNVSLFSLQPDAEQQIDPDIKTIQNMMTESSQL